MNLERCVGSSARSSAPSRVAQAVAEVPQATRASRCASVSSIMASSLAACSSAAVRSAAGTCATSLVGRSPRARNRLASLRGRSPVLRAQYDCGAESSIQWPLQKCNAAKCRRRDFAPLQGQPVLPNRPGAACCYCGGAHSAPDPSPLSHR